MQNFAAPQAGGLLRILFLWQREMSIKTIREERLVFMKTFYRKNRIIIFIVVIAGCVGSQIFQAIPIDLDRAAAPKQTIDVIAKDYDFVPETIKVREGTLLTLNVKSVEGTHGMQIYVFGIDERLDEGKTVVIELYAAKKGEYNFKCSHFCGIGHLGMNGKLIVE